MQDCSNSSMLAMELKQFCTERLIFGLKKNFYWTLFYLYIVCLAGIETFGKNAVVCGRSKNVGMPIAMLLHADGIGETNACKLGTGKFSHCYLVTLYDIMILSLS